MLPGLDELRGIAIAAVLVSHLRPVFGFEGAGWDLFLGLAWGVGVDLFFVISGLVVFWSLQRLRVRGTALEAAGAFYVRRGARVIPLVWCVTAILSAGMLLPRLNIQPGDVSSALSFTGNFHWAGCFDGRPGCGNPFAFGPFWSIATEAQFYLVAPLIVFVLTRRALIALSVVVLLIGLFLYRPWGGGLWAFRAEALMIGLAIGAMIGLRPWERYVAGQRPMGNIEAIFWVAVAAAFVAIMPAQAQGVATVLVALICGMIVVRTILRRDAPRGLGRGLAWIGRKSLALYLVHLPVLAGTNALATPIIGRLGAAVLGVLWALALAWLVTRLLGDPIYRAGVAWTERRQAERIV